MKTNTEQDFWNKIKKANSGCWIFTGGKFADGYGNFWFYGKNWHAHRLAWILTNGPILEGFCVLHRCDNRPCCNPDHLFLGTNADNVADRVAKGRSAHNCGDKNGNVLHPESRPRGENHGASKLTESSVNLILSSRESSRALARRLGVHHKSILNVRHKKTWVFMARQAKQEVLNAV